MTKDATAALGGKGKRKLHTHQMTIRKTANGGFIAQHQMADANGMPPPDASQAQEYALSDKAALMAHIDQHMDDGAGDDQPQDG